VKACFELSQADLQEILKHNKTVAVVGLSKNPAKASFQVAKYLQEAGYKIIPINPTADEILGQKAYNSLVELPPEIRKTIDVVDIFRPSEEVLPIVEQAVQLKKENGKPKVVWMQLGIENQKAAKKAKGNGLEVVMNKCIMMEHGRLFGESDPELEKIRAKKMAEIIENAKGSRVSVPVEVNDENFKEMVDKYPLVVIDCWAAWCGPCRMVAPIIDELAEEYAGEVVFGKLNVDENPEMAKRFNIMGIPTILIMKNGQEADRLVGAAPKLLIENKLKRYI